MEASHFNYPYDPAHKLSKDPPMTGWYAPTAHQSTDGMQNSSSTESLTLPVKTAKSEM